MKDEVRRPEGPPARSRGREGPLTSSIYICCIVSDPSRVMMSRPDGWVSWKEARVEHGLTYKVSELQISKDSRHGANEVLCFVGLDEDQGHGTQCSDSWTRYLQG